MPMLDCWRGKTVKSSKNERRTCMKMNIFAKWSLAALLAAALTSAAQTVATPTAPANQAATTPANEKQYTGMIMSVNDQEHSVTVKDMMFHKTFRLGDNCVITRWD